MSFLRRVFGISKKDQNEGSEPRDMGMFHPDFVLAGTLAERGEYIQVAVLYRKAAADGVVYAQYNLGVMYFEGRGVALDHAEAARWYRKAAEQGFAPAATNLGLQYANGDGVPKDFDEAIKWFRVAAGKGFADALFKLGIMFANGWGVPQNYDEAYKWVQLAANQGHKEASQALPTIAKRAAFANLSRK